MLTKISTISRAILYIQPEIIYLRRTELTNSKMNLISQNSIRLVEDPRIFESRLLQSYEVQTKNIPTCQVFPRIYVLPSTRKAYSERRPMKVPHDRTGGMLEEDAACISSVCK